MTPEPVYILGAGMHPWGKWGNDFTEYGMVAARAALGRIRVDWRQIQFVAGADTIRNGYPGFVAGATFAQKLGWNGVPVSSSYAACASGSQALQSARANILAGFCDVALVVGADTTPKGSFAPVGGERRNDPDWQRFHLIGATNPVYFALLARRRMDLYGATAEDFAQVKVKNSRHGLQNPNARYRKESSVEDVLASPVCRIRCGSWIFARHPMALRLLWWRARSSRKCPTAATDPTTTGLASTSSTDDSLRYRAFGFCRPCLEFLTFTAAKSSAVAPYRSIRRRASNAKYTGFIAPMR